MLCAICMQLLPLSTTIQTKWRCLVAVLSSNEGCFSFWCTYYLVPQDAVVHIKAKNNCMSGQRQSSKRRDMTIQMTNARDVCPAQKLSATHVLTPLCSSLEHCVEHTVMLFWMHIFSIVDDAKWRNLPVVAWQEVIVKSLGVRASPWTAHQAAGHLEGHIKPLHFSISTSLSFYNTSTFVCCDGQFFEKPCLYVAALQFLNAPFSTQIQLTHIFVLTKLYKSRKQDEIEIVL